MPRTGRPRDEEKRNLLLSMIQAGTDSIALTAALGIGFKPLLHRLRTVEGHPIQRKRVQHNHTTKSLYWMGEPEAEKVPTRDKLLEAIKAKEGISRAELGQYGTQAAVSKALFKLGKDKTVHVAHNGTTAYYFTDPANRDACVAKSREEAKQRLKERKDRRQARLRAEAQERIAARAVARQQAKVEKKAAKEADKIKRKVERAQKRIESLPKARQIVLAPAKKKVEPPSGEPINPNNVKPTVLPGFNADRWQAKPEPFFSAMTPGSYLKSDSALARAYG